jgi:hypothetical protein
MVKIFRNFAPKDRKRSFAQKYASRHSARRQCPLHAAVANAMTDGSSTVSFTEQGEISGAYLRRFILEELASANRSITHFELRDARIPDGLDLGGTTVNLFIRLINCKIAQEIKLDDANIAGFDFIGGQVNIISADRVTVRGSLRFCGAEKYGSTTGPTIASLRLCGAQIRGNLDLRRATLTGDLINENGPTLYADGIMVGGNILLSDGCTVQGEIRLNGSKIDGNLLCRAARFFNPRGYSLSAAGAKIAGTVYMSEADWIDGSLERSFTSVGVIRFDGATINGHFDCSGGAFTAPFESTKNSFTTNYFSIKANDLKLGGDFKFISSANCKGLISLINAIIGGDINFTKARLEFPGEDNLWADGVTVNGRALFFETRIDGVCSFFDATLKQGFFLDKATFVIGKPTNRIKELDKVTRNFSQACGVCAPNVSIEGEFSWEEIRKHKEDSEGIDYPVLLDMEGARLEQITDDERSWVAFDSVDLTNCTYAKISEVTAKWRLRELDRQYAIRNGSYIYNWWLGLSVALNSISNWWLGLLVALNARPTRTSDSRTDLDAKERFKPQPYIQLANAMRAGGYDEAAKNVLVHLERNRTRYSDYGAFRQLWRWLLDGVIKYGYSPFRTVIILVFWGAFCSVIFQNAFNNGRIIPVNRGSVGSTASSSVGSTSGPTLSFNPIVYSFDTLIPIVDLGQKKNFIVDPLSRNAVIRDKGAGWLDSWAAVIWYFPLGTGLIFIFNTFFGWLLTTLFVAGITGLLRTK